MSILIKGTEMPKTCEECQSTLGLFADECPLFAEFPKKFDYDPEIGNNRRYDGCPLVEIPLHGDLIDVDNLILDIEEIHNKRLVKWLKWLVDGEPTVIESEEEQ